MENNFEKLKEEFLKDFSFENKGIVLKEMVTAVDENGNPAGMVTRFSLVKFTDFDGNVLDVEETFDGKYILR